VRSKIKWVAPRLRLRGTLASALLGALAAALIASGCGGGGGGTTTVSESGSRTTTQVVVQSSGGSFNPAQIYKDVSPGVVTIRSIFEGSAAEGSGFVLDGSGRIVTNAHVVTDGEGGERTEAKGVFVEFPNRNVLTAKILGFDPFADVALLEVDPEGFELHPLKLGNDAELVVGQPVAAIGTPFGNSGSLTVGVVSATRPIDSLTSRYDVVDAIQTDAPITHGNSGGPLFDARGRVIGINAQIRSGQAQSGFEGVGFAVPIKTAADVASQVENGGQVHQAYLGISGGDIDPQIAHALNLPVNQGVLIERVLSGGPADDAGIKGATGQATIAGQTFPVGGDIITKVDGKTIAGMDDVVSAVNAHQPGDTITLTIFSGGQQKDVSVKLGDRPDHVQDSNSSTLP